ncbi:hypothetical protein IKQ38_01925 [Candidatus Saccharibacteria bacterium]|nr:hypothetical protein [Candidatus Saccharibacteria bacterium]
MAATAFVATFFGLAYKNTPTTDAAVKATDFKAGRIIDDEVFYDPNTMTVDEIQAHLDKYSANCDMWGSNKIGYGRYINGRAVDPNITRREYARLMREAGRTDYHDAPYVCISKYYENPTTHKTNFDTNAQPEEGMISAAQIIYNAAHEYNINPQVLLVMLKKESYVWGDTWPLKNEYNTVMGYACPDNAPCDSTYFGFHNQVMKAAWQLKYYKDHIYSYGYYPYMTNNIYYSPNYSCGTKAVYLENIATTSLYIYTPYTPNDAALANYPGEAYCGSYGNRNFFMYFSEWFGSTTESKQEQKISQRYNELKNSGNDLGNKLTDEPNCNIGHEGACVQAYENGVIIYSPETGAWENIGEIRKKFISAKSVDGELGFPIGPNNCNIGHEGACVQAYENGVIIYSPETGAWINSGEIREKYIKSGSVDGKLGFPIGDPEKESQKFENGIIIKNDENYYVVSDEIYKKVAKNTSIGKPTMDANCNIGHEGACVQTFENDVIIYSPETGAHNNNGRIREKFRSLNGVDGEFGFPIEDIIESNSMTCQKYQNGMICLTEDDESYTVSGSIYKKYIDLPFNYGNPLMNANDSIGKMGAVQSFDEGVIIYSPNTGAWENYGEIRKKYIELKSVDGILGFPIGPVNCNIGHEGACVQAYENGVIINSPETGAWENMGEIRKKYIELKSVDGILGFPITGINDSAYVDGVIYQKYERGYIYYNKKTKQIWYVSDSSDS